MAGRIRPKTISSGTFRTKRSRAVNVSKLTRMLVPKPKNAFQSPGTQSFGFVVVVFIGGLISPDLAFYARAARILSEWETHPKIPPWALIIFRPIS